MPLDQSANVTPLKIANGNAKIRHVFIRNYLTDCSIGIYSHEKENEQRVRINVDLAVKESDLPINDSIYNVICYEKLSDGIKKIVSNGHINLVETLAENIVKMCLRKPEVSSARVRVEKLDIIDCAESVGVEIERFNERNQN